MVCVCVCVIFTWASPAKKQEAKLVMSVFAQRPAASIRRWEQAALLAQFCLSIFLSSALLLQSAVNRWICSLPTQTCIHRFLYVGISCVCSLLLQWEQPRTNVNNVQGEEKPSTAEARLHLCSVWSWISGSLLSSVSCTVNTTHTFIINRTFVFKNPDMWNVVDLYKDVVLPRNLSPVCCDFKSVNIIVCSKCSKWGFSQNLSSQHRSWTELKTSESLSWLVFRRGPSQGKRCSDVGTSRLCDENSHSLVSSHTKTQSSGLASELITE